MRCSDHPDNAPAGRQARRSMQEQTRGKMASDAGLLWASPRMGWRLALPYEANFRLSSRATGRRSVRDPAHRVATLDAAQMAARDDRSETCPFAAHVDTSNLNQLVARVRAPLKQQPRAGRRHVKCGSVVCIEQHTTD